MHIQEVPNKRDVLKWTQPMDDILINALLSQQSFGNRVDKIIMSIEKGHLKNGMKNLKHNFYECYDLFKGAEGFCLEDNDMNDTGQVDSRAPSQSATSSSRGGK
ncbi:hypothetical protein GQ457_03G036000 [Hibiscus cannabinus]